jgi:hypothetical protein
VPMGRRAHALPKQRVDANRVPIVPVPTHRKLLAAMLPRRTGNGCPSRRRELEGSRLLQPPDLH